jgi:hypothetical protein
VAYIGIIIGYWLANISVLCCDVRLPVIYGYDDLRNDLSMYLFIINVWYGVSIYIVVIMCCDNIDTVMALWLIWLVNGIIVPDNDYVTLFDHCDW